MTTETDIRAGDQVSYRGEVWTVGLVRHSPLCPIRLQLSRLSPTLELKHVVVFPTQVQRVEQAQ